MKKPNKQELAEILKTLQEDNDNVVGVSWGYRQKDGYVTNQPALIVRVEQKVSKEILGMQNNAPITVPGYEVDIQEGGINPRRYINLDRKGQVIRNTKRNWFGSAGPVIKSHNGTNLCVLSNYHVFPEETKVTVGALGVGEYYWHGRDVNLDIAAIRLNPYGHTIFKQHASQGYGYDDPELDQTVWFDGGYGEPNLGRVVEIGLIAVNDPILGRFVTHAFSSIPLKGHTVAKEGDSGAPAWAINKEGQHVCVGVVNGSTYNRSSIVPMKTAMDIMKPYWFEWGQIVDSNESINDTSSQNSDLERTVFELKRQVAARDNAFKELSHRLSNLDPNTRSFLKITQKDTE